jgi:hypothetical protein
MGSLKKVKDSDRGDDAVAMPAPSGIQGLCSQLSKSQGEQLGQL